MRRILVVGCFLVLFLEGRCQHLTVGDLINSTPNLSELAAFISVNNSDLLTVALQQSGPPVTVFAPNNLAVDTFRREYPGLESNATLVRELIFNHLLVNSTIESSAIRQNLELTSAQGLPLWFYKTTDHTMTVNQAKLVATNLKASNGIIHIIDEVLYPMGIADSMGGSVLQNPEFRRLSAFVDRNAETKGMLMNSSQMITVFAPTNDVMPSPDEMSTAEMDALLKRHIVVNKVLFTKCFNRNGRLETYHGDIIIKHIGNHVYLKNSRDLWSRVVSSAGIPTFSGVVHRINGVLGHTTGVNLMEALNLNGITQLENKLAFEALDTALKDQSHNYTIFAPSDSAFGKFSHNPGEAVSTVLKRHVIKGTLVSSDLKVVQGVHTLNSGEKITIMKSEGKVYLEFKGIRATVISADKKATNGVIYIIDTVLSGSSRAGYSAIFLLPVLISLLF